MATLKNVDIHSPMIFICYLIHGVKVRATEFFTTCMHCILNINCICNVSVLKALINYDSKYGNLI